MMKKTVGNLLFLILTTTSGLYADVTVEVTDMNGSSLKQAGLGQPFIVQVSESDSSGAITQPTVEGLDSFVQQGTNFTMHTINGVSTVVYKYIVRADQEGTYSIGPVVIGQQKSHTLEIIVGQEMVVNIRSGKKQTDIIAELKVNKTNVVVGEKIECTLTVYSPDRLQTRIQELHEPPELSNYCTVEQKDGLEKGEVQRDRQHYIYGQWKWNLYPKQSGTLVIPAWSVDYSRLDGGNSFFSFMGFWENKRVYSNAVTLDVVPLPLHDPPVEAIGTFSLLKASLDTTVAQEGSGMLFTLTLIGDGNWSFISPLHIKGIPDALKLYQSSSSLETLDTTNQKKTFEYVIHGVEPGDWEIPSQQFTYFDTKLHQYKTLNTLPLYVTIKPSPVPVTVPEPVDMMPTALQDDILPLRTERTADLTDWALPKYLFFLLFLLPLLLLGYCNLDEVYAWYNKKFGSILKKRRAFVQAKKNLEHAQSIFDSHALHPLFVQLFAARLQLPSAYISKKVIVAELQVCFDRETVAKWSTFFKEIEQVRFVKHGRVDELLFVAASNWIELFEQKRIMDGSVVTTYSHSTSHLSKGI